MVDKTTARLSTQKWRTKRDFVLEELRQAVISGVFEPGQSLSLEDLGEGRRRVAGRYREALRELEADGLVVSEPHKGARVRDHTVEDAYQIFSIRADLEAFAARLAVPNLTEEELGGFREDMARMDAGLIAGDLAEVRDANRQFHYRVYRLTGWPRLESLMRSLWSQSPWSMLRLIPGRTARSIEEHHEIVLALETYDIEQVAELLAQHVVRACEELVEHLGRPVSLGESANFID